MAFLLASMGAEPIRLTSPPACASIWMRQALSKKYTARALALSAAQALWTVELPLALPMLLAGVKTAAVINVGTATVAAFIGAGGLGERIVAGLAVNDTDLALAGALPAALLALLMQWGFDALERRLKPW